MTNDYSGCRPLPSRGGKRGSGLRRKLSRPPRLRGETGELTTSARDERKATENKQWRSTFRCDDWEGSGEAKPPQWRSTASAVRRLQNPACWVPREKRLQPLNENLPSLEGREVEEPSRRRLLSLCGEYGGGEEHSSSLHLNAPRSYTVFGTTRHLGGTTQWMRSGNAATSQSEEHQLC